jgi:hypothetical protein
MRLQIALVYTTNHSSILESVNQIAIRADDAVELEISLMVNQDMIILVSQTGCCRKTDADYLIIKSCRSQVPD